MTISSLTLAHANETFAAISAEVDASLPRTGDESISLFSQAECADGGWQKAPNPREIDGNVVTYYGHGWVKYAIVKREDGRWAWVNPPSDQYVPEAILADGFGTIYQFRMYIDFITHSSPAPTSEDSDDEKVNYPSLLTSDAAWGI